MTTKRAVFLCVVSALCLGFSQPFYMPLLFGEVKPWQHYFGLLALIGYVPLFLALANKSLKQTFWLSFFSLTLQFIVVLYWMYLALTVHGHLAPLLALLITVLLPMLLALKGAVFFTMGQYLSWRFALPFVWIAPLALCSFEYFRNFLIFGGFPWGNAGYAIGQIHQLLQVAALFGVYGLVFLVGVINALIALTVTKGLKRGYGYLGAALILILLAFFYGVGRTYGVDVEFAPTIRVAVLQGNIDQEIKSKGRSHADEIIKLYQDLYQNAQAQAADLIVWPESAYPVLQSEDTRDIGLSFIEPTATIIGSVSYGKINPEHDYHVRNSAWLINYKGSIVARYDKSHLVPFGEYVPWPLGNVVDKIVPGMGAFMPGTDYTPTVLELAGGKTVNVGTTICYEGVFPEIARAFKNKGAEILVNLTNDAWYGFSSAPYQHLHMYRLRSVETGLPFVRATNTGISAFIDYYGQVKSALPLFERGVDILDVKLSHKPTLYALIGDVVPILCLALLIILYVAAVIPIHRFVRLRQWGKLFIVASLFGVVIWAEIYFSQQRFITDESAKTKILLAFLMSFLLMIGLLLKTPRSRAILMVSGIAFMLCSLGLAVVESRYFILGIAYGLLIYLLSLRIKVSDKKIN